MFQEVSFATFTQLVLLYLVVIGSLFYLLKKYGNSIFYTLVILLFYPAIFAFLGKNVQDGYKIVILFLTLWISFKRKVFATFKKGDYLITFFFVLFSLFYAISADKNNDSWTIIFSQYSRYFIAWCLWFLVRHELNNKLANLEHFTRFTYDLLLMQIILSIGKLIIFGGRQIESIVGSISYIGGAAGTTIPILGFIVLWFYRKGELSKKDWIFVVGLLLTGFLAGKRAVWFIMPVVIATFMIWVPRLKMSNSLLIGIFLAPLAFYLGIRLTPTLNPENKVWGSFNTAYAFDYAQKYQYGDKTNTDKEQVQGRGGATMFLWSKWTSNQQLVNKDWFGQGLSGMYATDYSEFSNINLEIDNKGSATGVYQTYVTTGYIGILFTLLFFSNMLWQVRLKRIRWVLIIILAWEYFMYTGIIFRTPAFMFLVIYFVHYSNYLNYLAKLKVQHVKSLPAQ